MGLLETGLRRLLSPGRKRFLRSGGKAGQGDAPVGRGAVTVQRLHAGWHGASIFCLK